MTTAYELAIERQPLMSSPLDVRTDLERETGYSVSVIEGRVMLTHPDRLPITDPRTVRSIVLNNTPQGRAWLARRNAERAARMAVAVADITTHRTTTTEGACK